MRLDPVVWILFMALIHSQFMSTLVLVSAKDTETAPNKKGWLSGLKDQFLSILTPKQVPKPRSAEDSAGATALSFEQEQLLLSEAEVALQEAKLDIALDKLVPILQADSEHQVGNALVGAILLSLGQYDTAEGLLQTAVSRSNFTDFRSVINLATLLRGKNQTALALKALTKAYRSVPKEDDLGIGLISQGIAEAYYSIGNYSFASEWFLSAALRRPSDTDLWVKASAIRYPIRNIDYKFAENVLLQGIIMNANNSALIHHLALVQLGKGRINEAIALFEEAVRLDDQNAEALGALATSFHSISRFEQAGNYYAKALRLQPNNIVLLCNYAIFLQTVGKDTDAKKVLKLAAEIDPAHSEVQKASSFIA